MLSQQVIGIQRILQNDKGQSWNNKKLRWSIVHNHDNQSKPYDILLEMVLVSSKRILKVNNEVKDTRMCSFGYEVEFDINSKLKGFIKQDSLTFQLFINGKSFTSLQANKQMYQPPRLDNSADNPWVSKKSVTQKASFFTPIIKEANKTQKKQERQKQVQNPVQQIKNTLKKTQSVGDQQKMQYLPATKINNEHFSLIEKKQQKKQVQNSIKDTQSSLMRILMEQKRKKKMQQA